MGILKLDIEFFYDLYKNGRSNIPCIEFSNFLYMYSNNAEKWADAEIKLQQD